MTTRCPYLLFMTMKSSRKTNRNILPLHYNCVQAIVLHVMELQ